MLDFEALKAKRVTASELAAPLTRGDLAALTNEMIDTMLAHLRECTDADVVFVPIDEEALRRRREPRRLRQPSPGRWAMSSSIRLRPPRRRRSWLPN